jgi:hypothetical protein
MTAPNGTRYTLTVPSNAVTEGVLVRMTLVTNITGWDGPSAVSAVRLEPEGLRFYGAAQLEVRFPTNLPPGLQASFGANGDTSERQYAPDDDQHDYRLRHHPEPAGWCYGRVHFRPAPEITGQAV